MEAGFEHLREAFAEILAKEVEFPKGVFVTVIAAKITQNGAHAKITLSVMPESRQEDVLDALATYSREIKDGLAHTLRLRRIPLLHYAFDSTEAEAADIEAAIYHLKKTGEI